MPSAQRLYDAIGHGYATTRHTDPRIAERIWAALDGARTVVNVGAGTGTSVWSSVGAAAENRAVRALRADLASGRWAERNRRLIGLDTADLGARLLIA